MMKKTSYFIKGILLILTIANSLAVSAQIKINDITPDPACAGTDIIIRGDSLNDVDEVHIDGKTLGMIDWKLTASMNAIIATIPDSIAGSNISVQIWDTDPTLPEVDGQTITIIDKEIIDTVNFSTSICQGVNASFDINDISSSGDNYYWDFGNGFVDSTSSNSNYDYAYSTPGNYNVIVWASDDGCFTDSLEIPITVHPKPTAEILNPPTDLCVDQDATFTAEMSVGTNPTYTWDFDDNPSPVSTQDLTISHTYSSTGTYTVSLTVESAEGCVSDPTMVDVEVDDGFQASIFTPIVGNNDYCMGDSVTLRANPQGADYLWSTGETTREITVTTSDTYEVMVSGKCAPDSASISISFVPAPMVDLGPDQTLCTGDEVNLTAQVISGTPEYEYEWTPNISTGATADFLPDETMNVSVKVVDSNGCEAEDDIEITVETSSDVSVTVDGESVSGNDEIQVFSDVASTIEIDAGSATISWEATLISGEVSGLTSSGTDSEIRSTFVLPDNQESALIEYQITGQNGNCPVETTFRIEVVRAFFIPNIVTPNGDGFNDFWGIQINAVDEFPQGVFIQLYNRAGAKVYDEQVAISGGELTIKWEGSNCPDGAYWYKISNALSNPDIQVSGAVTLLRGGN